MKENFVHVCFVIDESGSMTPSVNDVIGGFKRVVDEQREVKDGTCAVSLFKFQSKVEEVYRGKDVKDVEYLDEKTYRPGGLTAMNDGIGVAIDTIGKWLDGMKEEEKPEKNLIVIMTDGGENDSHEYTFDRVREMIKHQEDKYSWTFMYLGTDITDAKEAANLGIRNRGFASRKDYASNYTLVSSALSAYRCTTGSAEEKIMAFSDNLDLGLKEMNTKYEKEIGKKIDNND